MLRRRISVNFFSCFFFFSFFFYDTDPRDRFIGSFRRERTALKGRYSIFLVVDVIRLIVAVAHWKSIQISKLINKYLIYSIRG